MRFRTLTAVNVLILANAVLGDDTKAPQRIPRKDAFLGMHFDLHPGAKDTRLGADISEENIARLLDRVKPDFVQYDCKGHAGYTGYPTKVGWPSPGIVKDSLPVWRKVTRERGIGLYIHYSGVWDAVAIEHHPDWARVDSAGKPDPNNTSTFGPYVDELLIPQLKEVAEAYDLDGFWVDGECWAAQLDWSPRALDAWKKETGLESAPKSREEPHWLEWKMFHRRQFERYLARWVDALHAFRPNLQITSNWMYTTFAPKEVTVNLDFLSGDYSPQLSVDRGRVEARYLASTGRPWDLMAWGFNWGSEYGSSMKPAVHLQQESAAVLMQGGGFQIYYHPTRSGHIVDTVIDTMGEVADFCRVRQNVSHKSTSVPQVALLLSTESQFDRSDAVFTPYGCMEELEGALHALLELHYSVDILAEWQLQPRLKEFPLVVIPDSHKLADSFKAALLTYVEEGGSLLLLGEKCARLFEKDLGVRLEGAPRKLAAFVASDHAPAGVGGLWQKVIPTSARVVGHRHPTFDTSGDGEIAATMVERGKGKMAAVYGPLALAYFKTHVPGTHAFIGKIAAELFPEPGVRVEGPPCIDVALRRARDGQLVVHLLNMAGVQRADRFLHSDFIPAVGPIKLTVAVPTRPSQVTVTPPVLDTAPDPQPTQVTWSWDNGRLRVTLSSLHVHSVVVVE
jgi:hypothetical protein